MRSITRITTAAATAGLALATIGAGGAAAGTHEPSGTRSIAEVLLSDGNTFDHDWYDYDIVTEAALAVLKAKPNSPVAVLTKGDTALTVFAPTDRAFQRLAKDITGTRYSSEQKVFSTLAGKLGIDTIEAVLLYHVVPGATIDSGAALKSDGATLTMASGGKVGVEVTTCPVSIELVDADPNDKNPFVRLSALDINKGNKQIAHGISRVLRPLDI